MNYRNDLGISYPCLEVTSTITDSELLREILEKFVILQYKESNNGQADNKRVNTVHFLIEAPNPSAIDDEIKAMAKKVNIKIETQFLKEGDSF